MPALLALIMVVIWRWSPVTLNAHPYLAPAFAILGHAKSPSAVQNIYTYKEDLCLPWSNAEKKGNLNTIEDRKVECWAAQVLPVSTHHNAIIFVQVPI
jgi:hypothetical protein